MGNLTEILATELSYFWNLGDKDNADIFLKIFCMFFSYCMNATQHLTLNSF